MHFPVVLRPSEFLRPRNPDVLYIAGTNVELAQDCTKVQNGTTTPLSELAERG